MLKQATLFSETPLVSYKMEKIPIALTKGCNFFCAFPDDREWKEIDKKQIPLTAPRPHYLSQSLLRFWPITGVKKEYQTIAGKLRTVKKNPGKLDNPGIPLISV